MAMTQALAAKGRKGDTELAHLTRGEIVIPVPLQSPGLLAALQDHFDESDIPLERYTVGGEGMSINPETGLPEFGFFKKVKKIAKNIIRDPWQTIGTVAGTLIAPGLGTALGNIAGGMAGDGPGNYAKNLGPNLLNAALSGATAYAGSQLFEGGGLGGLGGSSAASGSSLPWLSTASSGGGSLPWLSGGTSLSSTASGSSLPWLSTGGGTPAVGGGSSGGFLNLGSGGGAASAANDLVLPSFQPGLGQQLTEFGSGLADFGGNLASDPVGTVSNGFGNLASGAADYATNQIGGLTDFGSNLISNPVGTITDTVSSGVSDMFKPGNLLKTGLGYAMQDTNTSGYDALSEAYRQQAQTMGDYANQAQEAYQPYTASGSSAAQALAALYGLSGPEAAAKAMTNYQAAPGFQFALNQGINALDASAARRGMLLSGNQQRAVQEYGTQLANQGFNDYLGNLQRTAGMGASTTGAGLNAALAGKQGAGDATTASALMFAQNKKGAADNRNMLVSDLFGFTNPNLYRYMNAA